MKKFFFSGLFFFVLCLFLFLSCDGETQALFKVEGTNAVLFANDKAAAEGKLDFSKSQRIEYRFDDSFIVPPNSSFRIEYSFINQPTRALQENYSLVLDTGTASWQLPMDFNAVFCSYAVPVEDSFNGNFSIILESNGKFDTGQVPVFTIVSVGLIDRFFGFYNVSTDIFVATPFVQKREGHYVIDVPPHFWPNNMFFGINAAFSSSTVLEFSEQRIETLPGANIINMPPVYSSDKGYARLFGESIDYFWLYFRENAIVFPKPIFADPGLVLTWPREKWRDPRYEIFAWDRFSARNEYPLIIIFDFSDYAMQAKMLKRLAFFVEKAGFRGRLAYDYEIADLHGWNAHDYRAEDLARFFDTARKTNFPLQNEEWELERILKNEGIIYEEQGSIKAGTGAIISISRQAPEHLRYRFMAHEGFHGLFFIDEDFREFCRQRWEQFSPAGRRFLLSFFDDQAYDTQDNFLVVKEFKGHLLQQSIQQAPDYFGRVLPLRLVAAGRSSELPPADAGNPQYWSYLANVFTAEAQVFSEYVNRRWGLTAGRVWSLRVR